MKSLREVGVKMDENFKYLKRGINEGMKPGCLKDKLSFVADDFRSSINCT